MRRGLLLGVLMFFIITAGWWFLFMSAKSSEIGEFNDELDAARLETSTLESRRDELKALEAREGEFLLGIAEVQSSIPATPDGAALIEDINQIAEDTDVDLLTFSPGLPLPSTIPGLVEIQIQMTFEAPYFKVLSFLFALEDLERLVRVDQISITSRLLEDGTNLLSTSITASAFSEVDLSGAAPVEATP
jgi:Tfp pilus assembly protein PilO